MTKVKKIEKGRLNTSFPKKIIPKKVKLIKMELSNNSLQKVSRIKNPSK